MSVDSFTRVADTVARLLATITWPSIVVVIVVVFAPDVRKRLAQGGVMVKAAGVELTIERATEAAAALGAAGAKGESSTSAREVATAVATATRSPRNSRLEGAWVLWVDDHPENNEYERQALGALGIRFRLSTSTPDALKLLETQSFNVIITDLGRSTADENDREAGIHLLRELRQRRLEVPCVVYAGSRATQQRDQLIAAGAVAATDRPTELFDAVVKAIVA